MEEIKYVRFSKNIFLYVPSWYCYVRVRLYVYAAACLIRFFYGRF